MTAIIFGGGGQDGAYLSMLLKANGLDILSVSRSGNGILGDVSDAKFVKELIKTHKPEYVFHFAANSSTSYDHLFENHETISTGTLNILNSVLSHSPKSKVFLSGSAMQFKNSGNPIDEETPFVANSPYSLSRIHSVYSGRYYREAFGVAVYVGYLFNHDSCYRTERHINQKIVQAVKRLSRGSSEEILIGDWDVKKEFNFAGDVVDAIWMLVNQETVHEAVIGSGVAYPIRDWLDYCFSKINKDWKDFVRKDELFKPEYDLLVSNPEKIKSLGWQPKVNFNQLADMMMEGI